MLKTDYKNNVLTAYIEGELDHNAAARLRNRIHGATESLKPRLLCLDFSGVSFMDSSGIGLVLGRYRHMKLLGGSLKVVNIPENMYKLFALSGLESLGVLK